jgi:hypothetical protein
LAPQPHTSARGTFFWKTLTAPHALGRLELAAHQVEHLRARQPIDRLQQEQHRRGVTFAAILA